MTFKLSKNFHGVGIGPLSKILAVKYVGVYLRKAISILAGSQVLLILLQLYSTVDSGGLEKRAER